MFKHIARIGFAIVLATSAASAHDAKPGKLSIDKPWARASIGQGKNAVTYLTVVNHGETADRMLAVTTPVARKAGLHTHLMEGGMMKMRPVAAIEIKGGASTVLKPGGLHVMLMGLKAPLKAGAIFPMTFTFEQAGSIEVEVRVATATAMGAGEMKMAGAMHHGKGHAAEAHDHTKPHDPPTDAGADQKHSGSGMADHKAMINSGKMVSGGHMSGMTHDHMGGMAHDHMGGMAHDHMGGMAHDHKGGMTHDHKGGMTHDHKGGMMHDHKGGMMHDHKGGMTHDNNSAMSHDNNSGTPHDHKKGMQQAQQVACTAPVLLGDTAESKPGGALYKGPLPKRATAPGNLLRGGNRVASGKPSMDAKSMKEMEGAHQMHKGQRGGELIMAPNQLHHLEVLYSNECGYQLFFYNAFTEPIRADRFRAFMLVVPEENDDFFEVLRFLTPSADGGHLATRISLGSDGPKPRGIFETELYIKFPESIQPMRFDVIVGTEVRWK